MPPLLDSRLFEFHFEAIMSADSTTIPKPRKCIFFDMITSNSAARIRLWLQLKGLTASVETKIISSSAELPSPEFIKTNPALGCVNGLGDVSAQCAR